MSRNALSWSARPGAGSPRQRPVGIVWEVLVLIVIGCVLLLVACDPASIFGQCSDDLLARVDPPNRTLKVGEAYTAAASAWGCRGTKRLSDEWRYFAVDTTVARVDSLTGRVTARAVQSGEDGET